jgi:UDP:flavonoid glycosyltransferase YjiC (YdhE family)
MIALPLFWDQYDNAQRLQETGFGARMPTYDWTEDQLVATVDRLLGDRRSLTGCGRRLRASRPRPGGSGERTCWSIWLCEGAT